MGGTCQHTLTVVYTGVLCSRPRLDSSALCVGPKQAETFKQVRLHIYNLTGGGTGGGGRWRGSSKHPFEGQSPRGIPHGSISPIHRRLFLPSRVCSRFCYILTPTPTLAPHDEAGRGTTLDLHQALEMPSRSIPSCQKHIDRKTASLYLCFMFALLELRPTRQRDWLGKMNKSKHRVSTWKLADRQ